MKFVLFSMAFLFSLSGCKVKNEHAKRIRISSQMQVFQAEVDTLITIADSLDLYYSNNLVMFRVPIFNIHLKNQALKNDTVTVTSESIKSRDIQYDTYIYQIGKSVGLYYARLDKLGAKIFNVDSFLVSKAYKNISIVGKEDSLVSVKLDVKSNLTAETYVNHQPVDFTYPDTTKLSYNQNFNSVPFSFSNDLDLLKKAKLYMVEALFKPSIVAHDGKDYKVPIRKFVFKFQEKEIDNEDEILHMFKKYKIDSKLFKLH